MKQKLMQLIGKIRPSGTTNGSRAELGRELQRLSVEFKDSRAMRGACLAIGSRLLDPSISLLGDLDTLARDCRRVALEIKH